MHFIAVARGAVGNLFVIPLKRYRIKLLIWKASCIFFRQVHVLWFILNQPGSSLSFVRQSFCCHLFTKAYFTNRGTRCSCMSLVKYLISYRTFIFDKFKLHRTDGQTLEKVNCSEFIGYIKYCPVLQHWKMDIFTFNNTVVRLQ